MVKKAQIEEPGRPGRKPSLNAAHTAVLRVIIQEQPQSSLDEVTRELLRRTGVTWQDAQQPLWPEVVAKGFVVQAQRWVVERTHAWNARAPRATPGRPQGR